MIHSILAGRFKLDGGAMFGVVPKSIWNRKGLADDQNLISLAMRCLLVELGNRLILIDTGIGNKLPDHLRPHYHIDPDISLEKSLHEVGISMDQVTDVILSHLHLDHAGGAITRTKEGTYNTTFPRATYWTTSVQWTWATQDPNPRERASFLSENLTPLEQSGQLKMIEDDPQGLPPEVSLYRGDGHTRGMLLPLVKYKGRSILFPADLLPTVHHIPVPYVPAYDIDPVISMKEKKDILQKCVQENYLVFLDHDADYECCTLKPGEKQIELHQTHSLQSCL